MGKMIKQSARLSNPNTPEKPLARRTAPPPPHHCSETTGRPCFWEWDFSWENGFQQLDEQAVAFRTRNFREPQFNTCGENFARKLQGSL
jgi:hypothetical protein